MRECVIERRKWKTNYFLSATRKFERFNKLCVACTWMLCILFHRYHILTLHKAAETIVLRNEWNCSKFYEFSGMITLTRVADCSRKMSNVSENNNDHYGCYHWNQKIRQKIIKWFLLFSLSQYHDNLLTILLDKAELLQWHPNNTYIWIDLLYKIESTINSRPIELKKTHGKSITYKNELSEYDGNE